MISASAFEHRVVSCLRFYFSFLAALDVPPPAIVMAALIDVRGYNLATPNHWSLEPTPIDRNIVILPDVQFESFECDVPKVIRPLFDGLWNAGGFQCSCNYNDAGSWKAR